MLECPATAPMAQAIEQYYGFESDTFYEAMQNPVYKSFPPFAPDVWRTWAFDDLPYAIVPCVQLAGQAGIAVPLHRAFAEILGTLLGVDPWQCVRAGTDVGRKAVPDFRRPVRAAASRASGNGTRAGAARR